MDPITQLNQLARCWCPPGELEQCRPRELRLKPAGIILVLLAMALLAGAFSLGLLLHLKASADHELRGQVVEFGKDVEARIIRRWTNRGKNTRYWIEYSYQVEGQSHRGRIELRRSAWLAEEPGAILPLRYLPSDPAQHLVRGHEGELMPLWLPYLIGPALALAAWLVTRPLISQRRLLAEGRPAPAVVTRHEKTQHGVVVHYVFSLLSGALAHGKIGPQRKPPALGSILCVLYEPERTRHTAVYPLSLVRTARPKH
jgi:hypothetical protein